MARRLLAALGPLLAWWIPLATAGRAATPTPSPSPESGLGSTGSGPGFVVLGAIIVAALVFSTWRLRRDR